MTTTKSPPESSSSTSSWFHKAITVAVLAVIVGYAVILHQKNMMLEKSMSDYSKELKDIKGELATLRNEKQALKKQLEKTTLKFTDESKGYEDANTDRYSQLLSKLNEVSKENKDNLDRRIGGIEKLLNDSNGEHSRELRKFQQNFDTIFTSSNKATKDIEDIQTKIKDMSTVLSTGNTVAFYAFMGSNVDPGIHQPIVFNHVVTNVGGAYNGQNGKFTAPRDGVYVFAWVLFCYEKGFLRSALVINNAVYGHVDTDSGSGRNFISATGVVVAQIKQGDVVYVRTDSKKGGILSTDDKRTQFSGWKIN